MSDDDFEEEMREFFDLGIEPGNLFLNILAGEAVMFQYDNPSDSDDDDYAYFDDDFDEDGLDDFEIENTKKIFVTLQDSHVIKRLSFHKSCGSFRIPQHTLGECEAYEDLYRLVEEVELMVRVWRKRLEHPYTAHLRAETTGCMAGGGGEKLVEGEDYSQSDYEYDGVDDEDTVHFPNSYSPNEALTKKKFCQSVKIFQRIFKTEKQFEQLQRTVVRMKKYVFRVAFQVFMDTLPPHTAARLPQELWEKIWKYTQNEYFSYNGSVPMLDDKTYYKAGQRTHRTNIGVWQAEQDRIGELFGAVGNLHISLFEILFKNPFTLLNQHILEELEGDGPEGNLLRLTRILWWKHFAIMSQKFCKLKQMDVYLAPPDEPCSDSRKLSLYQKVEKGMFTIRDVLTTLELQQENDITTFNTANILVSMEDCPLVAILDFDLEETEADYYLSLLLVDAAAGRLVSKIKTGLKYSLFQIELGKFAMRRLGRTGWKKNLCLTKERVSILYSDMSARSASVKVWSYGFPSAMEENVNLKTAIVDEVIVNAEKDSKPTLDMKTSVHHSKDKVVVSYQNPFKKETVLNVYDGSSGELVLNIEWPEEELTVASFKNNRAILINSTANSIVFFSTDSGEAIFNIPYSILNEGSQSYGPWTGLFDSGPSVNEFALIRADNSSYQLFAYDPNNEMAKPQTLCQGLTNDTYKLSSECLCTAKLHDGVIFFNRRTFLIQDYNIDDLDAYYHEICALNLKSQICCPILTMCGEESQLDVPKYNEISLNHFDPRKKFSDISFSTVVETFDPARRPIFFLNSTSFGVFMELRKAIKIFDFDHDERTVVEAEVAFNKEQDQRQKEEILRLKQLAQEKEKQDALRRERHEQQKKEVEERLVGKQLRVKGKVEQWKGTYGFIRSRGKAGKLGRIFFHRSSVIGQETRRFFKTGTELEYEVINGKHPGTFQAMQINVLPRPGRNPAAAGGTGAENPGVSPSS